MMGNEKRVPSFSPQNVLCYQSVVRFGELNNWEDGGHCTGAFGWNNQIAIIRISVNKGNC